MQCICCSDLQNVCTMRNAILIIMTQITIVLSRVLNPNGPIHQNYATGCIVNVAEKEFTESKKLLTVLTATNLTTKAFRIQDQVIKNLHHKYQWFLEVINGERKDFRSSTICLNCPPGKKSSENAVIKHNFQLHYKTKYCLMIVDNIEQFGKGLRNFNRLKSHNYHVSFFVYFAEAVPDYERVAELILKSLLKYNIIKAAVLIPRYSLTVFALYSLNVFAPSKYCGKQPKLRLLSVCKKGSLLFDAISFDNRPDTFGNCSIVAVAMTYPPFVLSADEGFEIEVLKELGSILDINFEIQVEDAADWGERLSPRNWSGPLERVYKEAAIAIGNVMPNADYDKDFDVSVAYYYERLVWVVPAALQIPRWKNIFVIFNYKMWLACFAFYVLSALLLQVLSHCADEYRCYKILSRNFLTGLCLFVNVVPKQPKTLGTRSVFISVATYSMILVVLYQTVLMRNLLQPVYESQIETVDDIFDWGMGIGGIKSYKQIFNVSQDKRAMRIYNIFEIYEEVNDTAFNWLLTVAEDRDTCTLISRFYTLYMVNKNHSTFFNKQGDEKMHILKELVFSYPVRMIQPRGFALSDLFDGVLQNLVSSGIILHWTKKYQEHVHTDDGDDTEDTQTLTVRHLQGAFVLLFFGSAFATLAFISELIVYYSNETKLKKHFIRLIKTRILKKSK